MVRYTCIAQVQLYFIYKSHKINKSNPMYIVLLSPRYKPLSSLISVVILNLKKHIPVICKNTLLSQGVLSRCTCPTADKSAGIKAAKFVLPTVLDCLLFCVASYPCYRVMVFIFFQAGVLFITLGYISTFPSFFIYLFILFSVLLYFIV